MTKGAGKVEKNCVKTWIKSIFIPFLTTAYITGHQFESLSTLLSLSLSLTKRNFVSNLGGLYLRGLIHVVEGRGEG